MEEEKYITFVKQPGALDELKARLDSAKVAGVGNENFGKTPDEIVRKFYKDQGIEFGAIDTAKVLTLVGQPATQKVVANA